MNTFDATLIAVVSGLTGILVKGADVLYNYVKNKTNKDTADNKLDEAIRLNRIMYDIISKLDQDSVPMVYTPRRLLTQNEDIAQVLNKLANNSDGVAKILDKLTTSLESIIRVLDRLEMRSSNHDYK